VFERFTERARQVVVYAQEEARSLSHNYIGTEHLLLGLLREQEGLGARVLVSLDVSLDAVREQVARIIGQGDELLTGQIPFTPRAKKVLELALREALSLGHNLVGTEHLLLGLVREGEGVASSILLDFGVTADAVRDAVIRRLSGVGGRVPLPDAPPAGRAGLPRRLPRRSAQYGTWRSADATSLLMLGWLLFAAALGIGILIGWAIWG
jgi:ATP-dependent Clp protease ATP-binding subunit ClpC